MRQIEALEELKVRDPRNSWLWDVRLKVLRYISSRYGQAATAVPDRLTYAEPSRPRSFSWSGYAGMRSPAQIREILEHLHANDGPRKRFFG